MDGDARRFRLNHGLGHEPVVLFMGRRDVGKGYEALLQAWPSLIQVMPNAVLCLAGPGGEIFQGALESIPFSRIRDLGIPGESDKADAIAGCDVFCLPSAHESFGIVYVEAWSYGKPVICGTAPACRELVAHGINGLHASQKPDELAAAMIELLANPKLAGSIGAAGKRTQRSRFTPERMMEDHLQVWGR
jgi:glycosyltransferase involved in cell wall biosynthesis